MLKNIGIVVLNEDRLKRRKRKRLAANRVEPLELPDVNCDDNQEGYHHVYGVQYAQGRHQQRRLEDRMSEHRIDFDDDDDDLRVEYGDDDYRGNVQALELPE